MCPQQTDWETAPIGAMDREALVQAVLHLKCTFPIDLTEEALRRFSLARLRHVYMALCLHAREDQTPSPTPARTGARARGRTRT